MADDNYLANAAPEVNYEKSIKRHLLVYKITPGFVISSIISYILFIVFVIGPLLICIQSTGPNSLIVRCCCILFVLWMVSNVVLKNACVKIEDKSIKGNKENILATMDHFFSDYDFIINDDKMMRSFTKTPSMIWGRIITILIDNDVLYLNISSTGKSDSPTLTHGLFNYLKAKRIAKYYKEYYGS